MGPPGWIRAMTGHIDLTRELTATVHRYRPEVVTARNMFATALTEKHGSASKTKWRRRLNQN